MKEQLVPGTAQFNEPQAFLIRGQLDTSSLRKALNELVSHHESLRTCFGERDGVPYRQVLPENPLQLETEDLGKLPENQIRPALEEAFNQDERSSFQLSDGPPVRVRLLKVRDDKHYLLWNCHHLVTDGWSRGVFNRQLGLLYKAARSKQPTCLEATTSDYTTYVSQQEKALNSAQSANYLQFWKEQLADCPAPVGLPKDNPKTDGSSIKSAIVSREITPDLKAGIESLSRQAGTTEFVVLLTAFQLLLSRLSGETDIVVGTPVADREPEWTHHSIGMFLETVPLRADFSKEHTFLEALTRQKTSVHTSLERKLPFEKLIEVLQPGRDSRHSPFFSILFNMHNVLEEQPLQLDGVEVEELDRFPSEAKYELTLYVQNKGGQTRFLAFFQEDLFRRPTMELYLEQLHRLLQQVVERPQESIRNFSLVPHRMQELLPDAKLPIPDSKTIPVIDQITELAKLNPLQLAVMQGENKWSYDDLLKSSHTTGVRLREAGVDSGGIVAITGSKSFGMISGLLAVMRNRAAFFLLDPLIPLERQRTLLDECGATHILLVGKPLSDAIPESEPPWANLSVIRIPSGGDAPADDPYSHLVGMPEPEPGDPAYVFFTSGTTGRPKGVLGNQRGLSHFIDWERDLLKVGPGDKVAQLTNLSFDVILRDIFLPLTSGAIICLPDSDELEASSNPFDWMREQRITLLHAVPSLARFWLSSGEASPHVPTLRATLFAGEPLSAKLVSDWREKVNRDARVINLYGPTETTMAKTFYEVPALMTKDIQPVGRPLPGTQVLILNKGNRICGPRESGEIVIRTPYRTNGYISETGNRKRFVQNPFREDPADICYRTGDRGSYDLDGTILIHGRMDDQIKIRGIRIEPSEIARTLETHPDVSQCVVIAFDQSGREKSLAAYFVLVGESIRLESTALRKFLEARLPKYMVPEYLTALKTMPLTKNGKVDRGKLPRPKHPQNSEIDPSQIPSTAIEKGVASICSEILGIKEIGLHDDFFALGGHSLLATKLVSQINQRFQRRISLWSFLKNPTVAEICSTLEAGDAVEERVPEPGAGPGNIQGESLSPVQAGLWILDRQRRGSTEHNIVRAFRVKGPLNVSLLKKAILKVTQGHDILRAAFVETTQGPRMVCDPGASIELEEMPHPGDRKDWLESILNQKLVLSAGNLTRMRLIKISSEEHVFVLISHYIVMDDQSADLLISEVGKAYSTLLDGDGSADKIPVLQFSDCDSTRFPGPEGRSMDEQGQYWRSLLKDASTLSLPVDHVRTGQPVSVSKAVRFSVDESTSRQIYEMRPDGHSCSKAIFLGAFHVLISRYCGQSDVVTGSLVNTRQTDKHNRIVGPFFNTVISRSTVSGQTTFESIVSNLEQQEKKARINRDLPFSKLVGLIGPPSHPGKHPLIQVMVFIQDEESPELNLKGLYVNREELDGQDSEFDIELGIRKTGGKWEGRLSYRTDLFCNQTIEVMASRYKALLERLVSDPQQPVSEVPIASESEIETILNQWNQDVDGGIIKTSVHELFQRQAAQTPSAVALVENSRNITYGELDLMAGNLAKTLIGEGVAPGDRVGILLERSIDFVTSIIATLKTGAVYVPIAKDFPAPRVLHIIKDAGIRLLLSNDNIPESLQALGTKLVRPSEHHAIDSTAVLAKACKTSPSDPAYVMYTSGSTGEPKGTVIPHQGIVRLVKNQDYANFSAPERFLFLASPSFDASTFEIWGPLLNGATCVIYPGTSLSLDALAKVLRYQRVTTLWLTAGLFNLIIDTDPGLLQSVQHVLTGGEALSIKHVRKALDTLPRLRLTNGYGPTECTTFACTHSIGTADAGNSSIPIGRPIQNTTAYILDESGSPAPAGIIGELHLGGPGLATGYLNNPQLTDERFIVHKLPGQQEKRLYRTGDLCRYQPNGCIEFIGRKDNQVKIRGYRVELGEIESTLARVPNVRRAVVIPRQAPDTTFELVAYVVPDASSSTPSVQDLKNYLASQLPDFSVPAHIVLMEALPLTANGKVDHRALPEPVSTASSGQVEKPKGKVEAQLVELWGKLFDKSIGRNDNFFALGGHSLMAIRLISEMEGVFGIRISTTELFQSPTPAQLAGIVSRKFQRENFESLFPLQAAGDQPPLFCLPGMKGDTYGFVLLAGHLAPKRPVYGLQAVGLDGDRPRHTTVEQMAEHYASEIEAFHPEGTCNLMGYSAGGWMAYAVAQVLRSRGREVRLYIFDTSIIPTSIPFIPFAFNQILKIIDWAPQHVSNVRKLHPRDRWTYIRLRIAELKRIFSRSKTVNKMKRKDPLSAAPAEEMDYFTKVIIQYRPAKYKGDVVYLSARGRDRRPYNLLLWKYFIKGRFDVYYFDGGHEGLIDPKHVDSIAERLESILDKLETGKDQ